MSEGGFGVYVHWPYCARICPYCDFNVYRARDRDPEPLLAAIATDLAHHAERIGRRTADTVFLGGGTPSLLEGAQIAALLEAVNRAFPLGPDAEITLEANPEDRARFADAVRAGVNRLSLGVQALDDASLKALGRWHDAADAVAAVEMGAATGARVSLDLIYARPQQSLADWEAELSQALALPAEHLSLYQLTVEPGTAFARAAARGRLDTPSPDLAADLFDLTQSLTLAAGAPAYEISNHARGPAAQARHNLVYWRGGEWVGVGPGAHGRLTLEGRRTETVAARRPEDYCARVAPGGVGWADVTPMTSQEAGEELLLMGLRVMEGLDRSRVERLLGRPLDAAPMIEAGLLTEGDGRLRLTAAGRPVADRIARDLALGV